jgi:hypothetical protein
VTKPHSSLDQSTIDERQVEHRLRHEVPVGDGVERVVEAGRETEIDGRPVRIERQGRTCEGSRSERGHVEAGPRLRKSLHVPGEGPAVGEEVVGEEDRLRPLEVGVPRQVGVPGRPSPVQQHVLQSEEPTDGAGDLPLGEKP